MKIFDFQFIKFEIAAQTAFARNDLFRHYEKRSDEVIPWKKKIAAVTPRNDGKTSAMTGKTACAVYGATCGCLLWGCIPPYSGDCRRGAKALLLHSARE